MENRTFYEQVIDFFDITIHCSGSGLMRFQQLIHIYWPYFDVSNEQKKH